MRTVCSHLRPCGHLTVGCVKQIKSGDLVQVQPHTDLFMRGVRYGVVSKVGRKYIHFRWMGARTFQATPESLKVVSFQRV